MANPAGGNPKQPDGEPRPARVRLGTLPLTPVTADEAEEWIARWAGKPPMRLVVTPNVDHVMLLEGDGALREAYERADLSLADGMPILWAARWLGLGAIDKVSGSDLLPRLCARGAREGWRAFFAGGQDAADLARCLERIGARHPGLVVGGHFPPWGFERDRAAEEALLAAIERFAPDLVLMAVGAPKSEVWLDRHRDRIGRGVGIGIGAGLRFLAGLEPRAPRRMQRAGLEWSWRLAKDPRRLWRRYLVRDMQFFPLVWRWRRDRNNP